MTCSILLAVGGDVIGVSLAFPDGLTTQEVAQLLVRSTDAPDRAAAEERLLELVADGKAARDPLGDDALWRAP
jgi:hypothetical protein